MKTDIIVQRAKTVIHDLGLLHRKLTYLKEYTSVNKRSGKSTENYLKRYILSLADTKHK